jgi:hypothetical protein
MSEDTSKPGTLTDEELQEQVDSGATFEEMPEGATWADLGGVTWGDSDD